MEHHNKYSDYFAIIVFDKEQDCYIWELTGYIATGRVSSMAFDIKRFSSLKEMIMFIPQDGAYLKHLVFTNKFNLLFNFLKDRVTITSIKGNNLTDFYMFNTKRYQFRNLDLLAGQQKIESIDEAIAFITLQVEKLDIMDCKYSFVYMANKIAVNKYSEAFKDMKQLTNRCFSLDLTFYRYISEKTHCPNTSYYKIDYLAEDVYSYDMTSAYPYLYSKLIMPMGRPQEIEPTIENLRKQKRFDAEIVLKHFPVPRYQGVAQFESKMIRVDEYGFKCLQEFYYDTEIESVEHLWIYKAESRLPKTYIAALNDMFRLKKETGDKNIKAALNGQIGKACQKLRYDTFLNLTGEVSVQDPYDIKQKQLYGYTNRYGVPQWASRVYSFMRLYLYQIVRQLESVGCEVIYIDTDCIKFTGRQGCAIFQELNCGKQPGQMGWWKFEGQYEYFKAFGLKNYGKQKNNKTRLVISGVDKTRAFTEYENIPLSKLTREMIAFKKVRLVTHFSKTRVKTVWEDWNINDAIKRHLMGAVK